VKDGALSRSEEDDVIRCAEGSKGKDNGQPRKGPRTSIHTDRLTSCAASMFQQNPEGIRVI